MLSLMTPFVLVALVVVTPTLIESGSVLSTGEFTISGPLINGIACLQTGETVQRLTAHAGPTARDAPPFKPISRMETPVRRCLWYRHLNWWLCTTKSETSSSKPTITRQI
ncbi:hypothetical protein C8R45DRAFT_944234 [Mycena sanguinolenta]|nr:hypothetical protein C8R45DRAFT_944234 [Mycena sanguinolenta]